MSYTRPPSTVSGNNTLDVSNVATQFSTMNTNDVNVDNTFSKDLNVELMNSNVTIPGKTVHQLVAYAPKAWKTKTQGTGDFLNVFPDQLKALQPDGTTGDPNKKVVLASLPVGARVINARLTNNGKVIEGSATLEYTVAIQNFTDPPGTTGGINIFVDVPKENINALGGALVEANKNIAALGSAGMAQNGTVVVEEGKQNISVFNTKGDNEEGDLALFLEYIL